VNDEAGQRFCYNCGASLSAPAPAEPAPAYQPPEPGPLAAVPQAASTSPLAVVSLVAGILSLVLFFIPLVGGLAAVICGHLARREIRAAGGRLSGEGMALVGLILGYINLGLTALSACVLIGYFLVAVAGSAR
jgi:hypothetical protein